MFCHIPTLVTGTSPHAVANDHDGEIVASKQRSLGSSQFRQVGVQYIQYSLSASSSSRLGPSACMLVIHICSLYSLGPGRGAGGGGRCVAERSEEAISTMGQLFNQRLLKIPRRQRSSISDLTASVDGCHAASSRGVPTHRRRAPSGP